MKRILKYAFIGLVAGLMLGLLVGAGIFYRIAQYPYRNNLIEPIPQPDFPIESPPFGPGQK